MKKLKKQVRHYKGQIYQATQELRDLTLQLSSEDFEEYMDVLKLQHCFVAMGGGGGTDVELVDEVSKKRDKRVGKYSSVCIVPLHGTHCLVEATNDQLIDLLLRANELRVFS